MTFDRCDNSRDSWPGFWAETDADAEDGGGVVEGYRPGHHPPETVNLGEVVSALELRAFAVLEAMVTLAMVLGFCAALATVGFWILWKLLALVRKVLMGFKEVAVAFSQVPWPPAASTATTSRASLPDGGAEWQRDFGHVQKTATASPPGRGHGLVVFSPVIGDCCGTRTAVPGEVDSSGYLSSSPRSFGVASPILAPKTSSPVAVAVAPAAAPAATMTTNAATHHRPLCIRRGHWQRLIEEGNDIKVRTQELWARDKDRFIRHCNKVQRSKPSKSPL